MKTAYRGARLVGLALTVSLWVSHVPAEAAAYGPGSVSYQPHPSVASPARRAYDAPKLTPDTQPARVPTPVADGRTASPAVAQHRTGEAGGLDNRRQGWGILSEIRAGFLFHDEGPFSSSEESGYDGNLEILFVSPDFLDIIWSPRPHVGVTVNSDGNTSQAYFGLSWEWSFWDGWFAGFSFGGSIHNGELKTSQTDRKELGCRLLFRESVEAGYRFGGRHAISLFLDHISNARLCSRNEGLENWGIRYGYSF